MEQWPVAFGLYNYQWYKWGEIISSFFSVSSIIYTLLSLSHGYSRPEISKLKFCLLNNIWVRIKKIIVFFNRFMFEHVILFHTWQKYMWIPVKELYKNACFCFSLLLLLSICHVTIKFYKPFFRIMRPKFFFLILSMFSFCFH